MLEKEFQYYLDNQDELVEKFNGKHLVIIGEEVVGAYDTIEEALYSSQDKYEDGTYLIQLCTPGDGAYSHTFHSRVSFV